MRHGLLLLLCIVAFCSASEAQILRVNKGAMLADSADFFTGSLTLDVAINDRNSTAEEQILFTSARGRGDLGYTTAHHHYYLLGDARYFQSTGGPLQSTGFVHLRANLMRKQQLSYEVFTQLQYDQGRNLDQRLLSGAGIRLRILDDLAFGTGGMYEVERWQSLSEESTTTVALWKSTSYLSGTIALSKQAELELTAYYQTGYDRDISEFRHRLSGVSRLDIAMSQRLRWTVAFELAYEDRPIIPISKRVYSFNNGVRYSF